MNLVSSATACFEVADFIFDPAVADKQWQIGTPLPTANDTHDRRWTELESEME